MSRAALRPNGNYAPLYSEAFMHTVPAGAAPWACLADGSNTSYVYLELPAAVAGPVTLPNWSQPGGTILRFSQFHARASGLTDAPKPLGTAFQVYQGGSFSGFLSWDVPNYATSPFTEYLGPVLTNQYFSNLSVRIARDSIVSDIWYEVCYAVAPVVTATGPTGTINNTLSPTVSWNFTGDELAQSYFRVIISPVTAGAGIGYDSGNVNSASKSWAPPGNLTNGVAYTATVYGAQYIPESGQIQWSAPSTVSFTVSAAPPSAPTSVTPTNGSTVITSTPTLTAVLPASSVAGVKVAAEFQLATDVGFTANVRTYSSIPPVVTSGTVTYPVAAANRLPQGVWYMRVRTGDTNGLYSAYTTTQAFTVSHPPSTANWTPTAGSSVAWNGTDVTLRWQFQDTSPTDVQTAYQVIVENDTTGALILDTGKVLSPASQVVVPIAVGLLDARLRWRVRVWDTDGVPNANTTTTTIGAAIGGFATPLEQIQGSVTDAVLDQQATMIADIGAGWMRGDYPASMTQPTKGTFVYSSADRWIIKAIAHGLKPIPLIYQLPTWMNGSTDDKAPPTNNQDYADHCAAVCAHLYSLGVRYVELWNEQNLGGPAGSDNFWAVPTVTDATYRVRYADMIKAAYPAIKAAAPGMSVILGGLSTADTVYQTLGTPNPPGHGALSTLQRYGELNLFRYCDVVAWHPYLDTDRPCLDVGTWPSQSIKAYQAALAIIDTYAPEKHHQIWSTETGLARSVAGSQATQATVAQSLWAMVAAGGCCASIKDRIGPFFWFTVRDRTTGDAREDSFGFASADMATHYSVYASMKTYFAGTYSVGGGYSDNNIFYVRNPPVATITYPVEGGTIDTPTRRVEWTFAAAGGRTQLGYRVDIYDGVLVSTALVHSSGQVSSSTAYYDFSGTTFRYLLNHTYIIVVTLTDSVLLQGADTNTATATWTPPAYPVFALDSGHFAAEGYIALQWRNDQQDSTFVQYDVYRRECGQPDTAWERIAIITDGTLVVHEYRDYLAPTNVCLEYTMTQVAERFGTNLESLFAPVQSVTPQSDDYWLVDPDGLPPSLRLGHVTADTFSDLYEMAEVDLLGRGRRVEFGTRWGYNGTLTVQLWDEVDGTTARMTRTGVADFKARGKALYLRNPFGDVWKVYLGEVAFDRLAGVAKHEYGSLTIPYTEVSS